MIMKYTVGANNMTAAVLRKRLGPMKIAAITTCIAMVALCVSVATSCSDTGKSSGKIQLFYSADEPGRWEAQAFDHEVQAVIVEDALGKRGIEVSVPLETDEKHYIEAIVLLDGNNRELAKKTFKRGEKAKTIFEISDKIKFPVYIVSKCNMHEMWRKKVEGTEKPK